MKKVQITPKKEEIHWSKPQWVQSLMFEDTIVLTNGEHTGNYFEGTALPCEECPKGEFCRKWNKQKFRLLTEEIQFTISNKD